MIIDRVQAVEIFTHNLLELHRGQGKEIYWRDTVVAPTIDQYEQMVKQSELTLTVIEWIFVILILVLETGGLFNLAVQLMQLFSTCSLEMQELLDKMALYFQVYNTIIVIRVNICYSDPWRSA